MNDEIKVLLDYLKDEKWEYYPSDMIPYKVLVMEERDKLLDYITNLQQLEQDHKETNATLMSELAKLEEENKDNLKCIKSLKEQLESVINENQKLFEKWYKNNDNIVNLISENEILKENAIHNDKVVDKAKLEEENERLKEDLKGQENLTKSYCKSKQDYKSRCEKAKDKIQYIIDYGFDYDGFNTVESLKGLIDMLVDYARESKNILQNGSDSK